MKKQAPKAYHDRDISWLAFNARILQEVESPANPLMERLKFAAIYSSNLEEFYKVRVASHRFVQTYKGDKKNKFGYRPSEILQQINLLVGQQQQKLGRLFYQELIPSMAKEGIHLLTGADVSDSDRRLAQSYHDKHLHQKVRVQEISHETSLELENQRVYLYAIQNDESFIIDLDYVQFGRFIILYESSEETRIMQLDDILKFNMGKILNGQAEVYAVKISRDAELYIDEEQEDSIVKKIEKSLKKRNTGMPSRLLFDENIPFKHIDQLRKKLKLDMTSLVAGGRYHNFYDFFGFPEFPDKAHLYNKENSLIPCTVLDTDTDWFTTLKKQTVFLSYPYQSFDYVARFLDMAADDDAVEEINITLYRVSKTSAICTALERAAQRGKKVFVLDEVLARFDEESNLYWGKRLEEAGAIVKYSTEDLKVHAKTYLIKRREGKKLVSYAYLGTGNLNEKTSRIYADHGILTSDRTYTHDLKEVFRFLKDESYEPTIKKLLVAPFTLRSTLEQLIDQEIAHAKAGQSAQITLKMNSLEDPDMIDKLREAADAGVRIDMVVRGICCYKPLNPKQAKHIRVVSILDQYLEHTRVFHFHNNGDPQSYLSSADLMTRNLSKRIEIAFPVTKNTHQQVLLDEMQMQLSDGIKGRIVEETGANIYVQGKQTSSSQQQMFQRINQFNKEEK